MEANAYIEMQPSRGLVSLQIYVCTRQRARIVERPEGNDSIISQ